MSEQSSVNDAERKALDSIPEFATEYDHLKFHYDRLNAAEQARHGAAMFSAGVLEGMRQAIHAIEQDRKEMQPSREWSGMKCAVAAIERALASAEAAEARATSAEAAQQKAEIDVGYWQEKANQYQQQLASLQELAAPTFAKLKAAEAARDTLRQFAQHSRGCASLGCEGHYDGTVCTSDCPTIGACDCGLDAVLTGEAPTPQGEAKP